MHCWAVKVWQHHWKRTCRLYCALLGCKGMATPLEEDTYTLNILKQWKHIEYIYIYILNIYSGNKIDCINIEVFLRFGTN